MIKTETITVDGRELTRTWSDAGRYVVRGGVSYGEAIDPAELGRTYTEGEIMEDKATAEELLEIIVGGASE